MSLLKKLAGQTAIYGLSSILGRALNFLFLPLYTRVFPEAEYGIFSDLYAAAGLLAVVFVFRMETAFFRYGAEEERREEAFSTALWSVAGTSLLLASLILVFSKTITGWLAYPAELSPYVTMFGLILAFDALAEIPLARLRLENKAMKFAAIRLANIGLVIVFNLFFLVLCPWVLREGEGAPLHGFVQKFYDPSFGVGYVFLANLAASAGMLLLLLPSFRRLRFQFDLRLWRTMVLYAAPLILASLAGIADEVLDRQLLKFLLPGDIKSNLAQVGIYSACYKLATLMTLFTQAFRYAAEPFFFSQAKNKDARLLYAEVAKWFTLAGAFAFLAVALYLDVFKLLIGENFRGALGVVPVLLMSSLLLGLYYNLSIWYKLTDQTMLGAWIALGGAALMLALNVWWIPVFGYTGSAWAKLICYAGMTAACWWWGQKHYPVNYDWKRMGGYVGLALGLYFLSELIRAKTGGGLVVVLAFNTVLVGLFLLVVWRWERGMKLPKATP